MIQTIKEVKDYLKKTRRYQHYFQNFFAVINIIFFQKLFRGYRHIFKKKFRGYQQKNNFAVINKKFFAVINKKFSRLSTFAVINIRGY